MAALNSSIPFIVGNLGADAIRDVAKRRPIQHDGLRDELSRFSDLGFTAVEDYIGWNVVEPRPDQFDFSLHLDNRRAAERAGLRYIAYPWVHALPHWMMDPPLFTPFRCLEHDKPTHAPSTFHPTTRELFDRFYARLGAEMGKDLHQLTLAAPSDYGEIGYPSGMAAWFFEFDGPLAHSHEGYWCGDPAARESFRAAMLERHGSLANLNQIWRTTLRTEAEIEPISPDPAALSDGYREDFLTWYRASMLGFVAEMIEIGERHFPDVPKSVKIGYGSELGAYGQDYTGLGMLLARHGLSLWSTYGSLPVVHHKRIQTICRTLGVRYCTEAVTERSRQDVLNRMFEDAADGARCFFEFHHNFDKHPDAFLEHAHLLRGDDPLVDVAVLFHSTQQLRQPRQPFPPRLQILSEPLRDLLDFEIVDEELLGGTSCLHRYGVLVVPDAGPLRTSTLVALSDFAHRGGLVVVPEEGARTWLPQLLSGELAGIPSAGEILEFESDAAPRTILEFGGGDDWPLLGQHLGVDSVRKYFGGDRDDPCRWIGAGAGFRLPIEPGPAWTLLLTLYADARTRPRQWQVFVGDRPVSRLSSAGAEVLRVDLGDLDADPHVDPSILTVRLAGPTFRPAALGESDDRRDLGLILKQAELIREDAWQEPATPLTRTSIRCRARIEVLREHCLRRMGRGGFLLAPAADLPGLVAVTQAASAHRSGLIAGACDFLQPDGRLDRVRVARFADRLLLFNPTELPITKQVRVTPERTERIRLEAGELREIST